MKGITGWEGTFSFPSAPMVIFSPYVLLGVVLLVAVFAAVMINLFFEIEV
jgi:hypothetical protein